MEIHPVAHDSGVHRSGDLRRAGRLRAVADRPRQHRHRVDHRMRDRRIAAALQIADACASANACGDRAAIGREPSDARFLMNGDEVGQRQRPQKLFPARAEVLGVADHRQRGRDPLISGAGQDHDRHFAAAHSRVGASRRIGLRLRLDIAVRALEQNSAYRKSESAIDGKTEEKGACA